MKSCALSLVAISILLMPLQAQQSAKPDMQKSCHDFVQAFYDWYVPKSLKAERVSPMDLAFKSRKSSFSPELVQAIKEDEAASAKSPGEIVGLDFDPILNSQDTAEKYVAGKVTIKGDTYRVEVYRIESGKRSPKPAVIPELVFKNGQWVFMNFHYADAGKPEDENLLSLLKGLKKERQRQ